MRGRMAMARISGLDYEGVCWFFKQHDSMNVFIKIMQKKSHSTMQGNQLLKFFLSQTCHKKMQASRKRKKCNQTEINRNVMNA